MNDLLLMKLTSLFSNKDFNNEIAQIKSKSLLHEVSSQATKFINWNFDELRVLTNITGANLILQKLFEESPIQSQEIRSITLQLATIWEALSKLDGFTDKHTALVNAAIYYQLAGYQANATCIARQIETVLREDDHSLLYLTSLFLQRLFLRLKLQTSISKEIEYEDKMRIVKGITTNLINKAFSYSCNYFLQGAEGYLLNSQEVFLDIQKILDNAGDASSSVLVKSLRMLLPVMHEASTWAQLSDLGNGSQSWQRYLTLLARGTGTNLLESSSISELWPSQVKALKMGLLDPTESKIIRMPTSAGKTRVAELALVNTLVRNPGAKCIYVAPYRALVWELEQILLNIFSDLGFRVSSVFGAFDTDDLEQLLIEDADILVLTPEKLDLLNRIRSGFLEKVKLFILNEGHMISDGKRGIKFELLLTKLKRRLVNSRFIHISAVVPTETLEDLAKWFNINISDGIIDSTWRPSIQRYASFEWTSSSGVIKFEPSDDNQVTQQFVHRFISEQSFDFQNPVTGRLNHKRFPKREDRSECAAELAIKFADLGPVLIFCAVPDHTLSVARALQRRLNYTRLKRDDIPRYFLIDEPTRSLQIAEQWLGPGSELASFLREGIAVHNGNLPEFVRKAIEADFRESKFRIIAATNTLAQGINLPLRTVIVHTCRRFDSEKGYRVRISDRDYWNIAGRAGRAVAETEGMIIHMVMNSDDSDDYKYYLSKRSQLTPVRSALFDLLIDLVSNRISEETLYDKLDPEVLALLVEESGEDQIEKISEILDESLVKEQCKRQSVDIGLLKVAFSDSAKKILNSMDREYLTTYSETGLSAESCKQIRARVEENKSTIIKMLKEASEENIIDFVNIVLATIRPLKEMQTERDFGGDIDELLGQWLLGKNVSDITLDSKVADVNSVAKFVEDSISYKFPWGASALIRIACQVCGIDSEELSLYAKFLPSMIKYGVPNPIASWAMTLGVPFRETAIELASDYLKENSNISYIDFLNWIQGMSSEDLSGKYRLKPPILNDILKSL